MSLCTSGANDFSGAYQGDEFGHFVGCGLAPAVGFLGLLSARRAGIDAKAKIYFHEKLHFHTLSKRSGRFFLVFSTDFSIRHFSILASCPESKMLGTLAPSNSAGRL